MKRWITGWLWMALCAAVLGQEPVQVDFFYEPGCRACELIEADLLPAVLKRFADLCVIRSHDIGIETNFLYLLELEDGGSYEGSDRAYLFLNRQVAFGSSPQHDEVFAAFERLLSPAPACPVPQAVSPDVAEKRFHTFTLPAVVAGGLVDGLNPCAISTLVFFMSLLAVAKVRNRQLVLLGISFCLASFLTYLALGFGLFRILHLFSGFTALRIIVEWGMMALLLLLAGLSFRDALRFRKTGQANDVTLQLSTGMKKRIHGVMRKGLGSPSIVLGGLFVGMVVTALESVCTGQVYVPTLVLILKDSSYATPRAWLLLLLYNAMFILPVVAVFVAVYSGLRTERLLKWSQRHVVVSKLLLALFFLLMAVLVVSI